MSYDRNDVLMMARIKNEENWIGRNLERTWKVCGKVLIWDDGSTDGTEATCLRSVGGEDGDVLDTGWGFTAYHPEFKRMLYYFRSPFKGSARPKERVSEIRDKNLAWYFAKSEIGFKHVLLLDGDEMLSLEAVRRFPGAVEALEQPDGPHMLQLPFIYYWDDEQHQRVDGIYGDAADGFKRLRFPRLFTICRGLDEQQLFDMHFAWRGSRGGFHCGSVPQQEFLPNGQKPMTAFADLPVIHFGYLEEARRQAKFEFYNRIDPDNEFEGGYKHIVGLPNIHAPGPVVREVWEDK